MIPRAGYNTRVKSEKRIKRFVLLLAVTGGGVLPLVGHWAAHNGYRSAPVLIHMPPLIIYSFLFILFARTLKSGRKPLISVLAQRFHGRLSPQSVVYTRRLTLAWAILFAVIVLELIALAFFAPAAAWSLYANAFNFVFIAVFFLAEFCLRRWFVTDVKHMRLFELLRFLKQTRFSARL